MVVDTARQLVGQPLEIMAALGHGRSYGMTSSIGFSVRSLPGILQSGIWDALDSREAEPQRPTFALITDIGNDIIYGAPPGTVVDWVQECVNRLDRSGARIAMSMIPIHTLRQVKRWQFRVVKTAMFPTRSLSYRQALERVEILHDLLQQLAQQQQIPIIEPPTHWYGFDPIHVRRKHWSEAWPRMLQNLASPNGQAPVGERTPVQRLTAVQRIRVRVTLPKECRLVGLRVRTPQPGRQLSDGTTISLF